MRDNLRSLFGTIALVVVTVWGGGTLWRVIATRIDARAEQRRIEADWEQLVAGAHVVGGGTGPIIVEFGDYQCPACRLAHARLFPDGGATESEASVVYRHFPNRRLHPFSEAAAIAAVCADFQGRFAEMHHALFQIADWGVEPNWILLASGVGVEDMQAFEACLSGSRAASVIRADSEFGRRLGIQGTPTFVTQERMMVGLPPEGWLGSFD